jgi:hypothetical protein
MADPVNRPTVSGRFWTASSLGRSGRNQWTPEGVHLYHAIYERPPNVVEDRGGTAMAGKKVVSTTMCDPVGLSASISKHERSIARAVSLRRNS